MRNLMIVMGVGLALATLAYFVPRGGRAPRQAQQATSPAEPALPGELDDRLGGAALHAEQRGEQQQRAYVDGKIKALESRLRDVEAERARGQGTDDHADEAGPDGDAKPALSEAELGHWMAGALRTGDWDRERTDQARDQVEQNLARIAGVQLEVLDCGKRFCRATFARDDGERPIVRELFGLPPFTHEGFTVDEPDGRIAIYFTGPGESLAELRREAADRQK
jgi:hypothetical protein